MGNRYKVYSQHKGGNVTFEIADLDEAHQLAHSAAKLGHDALYRVYELTSESVTGERFATAWSILDGRVKQLSDVTIPGAHW